MTELFCRREPCSKAAATLAISQKLQNGAGVPTVPERFVTLVVFITLNWNGNAPQLKPTRIKTN